MKLRGYVANVIQAIRAVASDAIWDGVGLSGCALIVYGIHLVNDPAAFIAAGIMLLIAAWLRARRG